MTYKQGMMINIDGMDCCVLDSQEISNETYIYVAEIVDEDITNNFYVYKIVSEEKFEKITNSDDLKNLLPLFVESIEENL